jgi:hypothetical protein
MSQMQRRPGGESEAPAGIRLASENSVALALVEFTIRIALSKDGITSSGTRLCLDDLPEHSRVVLDVTRCPRPNPSTAGHVRETARRGVGFELEVCNASSAREWHRAIWGR